MVGQPTHDPIQTNSVGLQDAIQSQDAIGWDNFFEGCIAKDWEQAQDTNYKWCCSRKSAWPAMDHSTYSEAMERGMGSVGAPEWNRSRC
jgi:hypothetical protein